MKKFTTLIVLVLLCSFSFLQAQQVAKPDGNTINFLNSSLPANGGGGQLGHVQIAPFADIFGNSQWISLGASNSGNPFYGMRIQKKSNFATFSVNGSGSQENLDVLWGGSANSDFNFKYSISAILPATTIMTIKPNGRVGIGTTNPTAGLDVKVNSGINIQSVTGPGFPGNIKMADGFTNTTSRDDLLFSADGGFMFKMDDNGNGISNVQGFNVYNRNNQSVFAIREINGNVGIGLTNPTEKLHVNGNIRTNVSFINSDRRFKKNIETLLNPMDLLKSIKGVSYLYDLEKFPNQNFNPGKAIGFIAQDFEKSLPELLTKDDDKGFYAINYDGVIPILVEAVKELAVDLNSKNKKIETDAIRIQQLEEEMESLKAAVQQLLASDRGTITEPKAAISTQGSLSQNTPNPFGTETMINYSLSEEVKSAAIIVYDLQGKELKRFENLSPGENSLRISSDLQNGIYLYSLIVDGELVDTKRMIASR